MMNLYKSSKLISKFKLRDFNLFRILEYGGSNSIEGVNPYKTLKGHTENVIDIQLCPLVNELLVTLSKDKSIRVWNIYTGNL